MTKIEIELSDSDYQLIAATATCANETIEEYCRHIIMTAVSMDLKEVGNQPEENSTFHPRT
jgi:hypothetical protein